MTPRLRTLLLAALGAVAAGSTPLLAVAAPAAPTVSAADQALVTKASAYLQGLAAAQGRFVQTDARGRMTQGTFYLKRPGKIRFEYDKPSGLLIVSDGANVKVQDSRLKTFDTYPLGKTPLSIFLAKQIRLDQGVVIERVTRTADGFAITARDGRNRTAGAITLAFADAPMRLKEWTVLDAQGGRTRVQLTSLQPAGALSDGLFVLRGKRGPSGG